MLNDTRWSNDDLKKIEQVGASLRNLAEVAITVLTPIFEQLHENLMTLHAYLRREYDAIGAPYGPTDSDMYRFLKDRCEMINALREVADLAARDLYRREVQRKIAAGTEPGVALVTTPLFDAWSTPISPDVLFRL